MNIKNKKFIAFNDKIFSEWLSNAKPSNTEISKKFRNIDDFIKSFYMHAKVIKILKHYDDPDPYGIATTYTVKFEDGYVSEYPAYFFNEYMSFGIKDSKTKIFNIVNDFIQTHKDDLLTINATKFRGY